MRATTSYITREDMDQLRNTLACLKHDIGHIPPKPIYEEQVYVWKSLLTEVVTYIDQYHVSDEDDIIEEQNGYMTLGEAFAHTQCIVDEVRTALETDRRFIRATKKLDLLGALQAYMRLPTFDEQDESDMTTS